MAPRKSKMNRLTPRQQAFAEAYMVPGTSQVQAALKAGYSPNGVESTADGLIKLPQVEAYLKERRAKVQARHDITLDRVIAEYAKIAFMDMSEVMEPDGEGRPRFRSWDDIPKDHKTALSEITIDVRHEFSGRGDDREMDATIERIRFKAHDKVKALDALGRHLGMFPKDPGPGDDVPPGEEREIKINVRGGLPQAPLKKTQ